MSEPQNILRFAKGARGVLAGLRVMLDSRSVECHKCEGEGCLDCLNVGYVIVVDKEVGATLRCAADARRDAPRMDTWKAAALSRCTKCWRVIRYGSLCAWCAVKDAEAGLTADEVWDALTKEGR